MRVAVCHNHYLRPGGEDAVFRAETELLRSRGVEVFPFTVHNRDVRSLPVLALARKTIWNGECAVDIETLVRREAIDVVHFHNTLPLLSPAAYYGARRAGAAVVQTLHNYRLICPGATLFRNGMPCEQCVKRGALWPAVKHGCYRGSRTASAAVVAMLTAHRVGGTYRKAVDAYVALSEFARTKLVGGGLPADRVFVKPNFLEPDPGVGRGDGGYALFVGRLSPEKGLDVLLEAWTRGGCEIPLRIGGGGPMEAEVRRAAEGRPSICVLGELSPEEVDRQMKAATFLVVPSLNYEGFPRILVEAYARGLPVLASRLGSLTELVREGETGLDFTPGDPADLAAKAARLFADQRHVERLRPLARGAYERLYRGASNFDQLKEIYQSALLRRRGDRSFAASASPRPSAKPITAFRRAEKSPTLGQPAKTRSRPASRRSDPRAC